VPATATPTPTESPSPQPEVTPSSDLAHIHPPKKLVESHEAVLTPEESLEHFLGAVAQSKGWTIEQAAAQHRVSEIVSSIAQQLVDARPDMWVGGALSPEPGGAPTLYIKGPADEFVRNVVDSAEIKIDVADNQPFSLSELDARLSDVSHALSAQGYKYAAVTYDVRDARKITVELTREPGLPDEPGQIVTGLPESVRADVSLTIKDAPVSRPEGAFGGMELRKPGYANWCTSGWSVRSTSGTTGVSSAGHCDGVDRIWEPGVGAWSLTPKGAPHEGAWRDVRWYTSDRVEPALFYSSPTTASRVTAVRPRALILLNDDVCFYGRASNAQDCAVVENPNVSCLGAGGWLERLVMVSIDAGIGGDSGGPWFSGTTAYGSHVGDCADLSVFSVADLYDEALGVSVRVGQVLPANGLLWPAIGEDDRLTSTDGRFVAAMQTDGNFVIYRTSTWTALWATSQCGQTNFVDLHAVLQSDANFVLYPSSGSPARWATSWAQNQPACISNQQTNFGAGAYMVMQNDGNLVIYRPGVGAIWASNTCCY
jgi:hypothetical protein